MKVLFTGASSFTGYWFVKQLAERGHEIWATFTKPTAVDYMEPIRSERVRQVGEVARPLFDCRFGDDEFRRVLRIERFDLLCHHGADVTNYRSPDFDVAGAVANNTRGVAGVVGDLAASGTKLVVTGSVFELGEGAGTAGLPAFSPYGLSKALTWQTLSYYATKGGIALAKFVIPNPFGPWEEPRFTAHLMRTWSAGETAAVRTPAYVRDNIPVSLLAQAYVAFCEAPFAAGDQPRANPSGYVERQGEFAERVAREVRSRTGWECRLECVEQTEFEEPLVRTNTEPAAERFASWSDKASWDEFADWYLRRLKG